MGDYAAMTDEQINRLCAERLEAIPLNAEKTVAAMYRNASLSPDDRELAESHLLYMRLASPRQHCVASLNATEGAH